jgi:hypothetical protein
MGPKRMGQPPLRIGGGVKLASSFTLGHPPKLSKKGLKGMADRQLVRLAESGNESALNEVKRRQRHGRHIVVHTRLVRRPGEQAA